MTLRPGKLPGETLARLLSTLKLDDPSLLVRPGIGRDAAVIDTGNGHVLVATSDPITFATEHIGWYAVHVNANDVACMGARPRWMLLTLLLPAGAPDAIVAGIFEQAQAAAGALGVTIIGGHTEVTPGIDRPILSGTMLGSARREDVITGEAVHPGDAILLTRGIAIEGTALLAQETADRLRATGLDQPAIERAARLLFEPGISVVKDAGAICDARKPHLLHDPTEGGIATALEEMAAAANARLSVRLDAIPVLDETKRVCEALRIDPIGLLASGALLAIVDPGDVSAIVAALDDHGTPAAVIGEVVSGSAGVILAGDHGKAPFPRFDRDELARFFEGETGAAPRTSEGTG